jgi:hypothetical protein
MGLRSFIEKTQKRERKHQEEALSKHEEEEDEGEPAPPDFSIETIVRGEGETHIAQAIRFSWAKFLSLYEIAEHNMEQYGRGRKRKFKAIDRFFILMIYLTSGFTTKAIATSLVLIQSIVHRITRMSISELDSVFDSVFAPTSDAVHCTSRLRIIVECSGSSMRYQSLFRVGFAMRINTIQASIRGIASTSKSL